MKCFDEYVYKYNMDDSSIKYKYYHSYRVMNIMEMLATKLNLSEEDIYLAKVIGLFHDIGRFEQRKIYNSYSDKNMDHGDYGIEVLKEENILDKTNIDKKDYEVVYSAIKNHNKFMIEEGLNARQLFFSKLIRDADKLDILYVLGSREFDIFKQGEGELSEKVKRDFFNNNPLEYYKVKTSSDEMVARFCFVFDINFKESFEIIYREKYYEKIYDKINNKDVFKDYIEHINEYIKGKI